MGLQEPSGVFELQARPQLISKEELEEAAKFVRPALLGKVRRSADSEDLWDITVEETNESHWMAGPFTVDRAHDCLAVGGCLSADLAFGNRQERKPS